MKLSDDFTTEEATRSHKAEMLHIDNSMPEDKIKDAKFFALLVMQPIRTRIGKVFNISSWHRCPALNKAVGGVKTSEHLTAMAADFLIEGMDYKETFDIVLKTLKDMRIQFDQCIIEKNTKTGAKWVHLGLKKRGNRNKTFSLEQTT